MTQVCIERPVNNLAIPRGIINNYHKLVSVYSDRENWNYMDEKRLWEELALCILSSNVPYEMAKSALLQLRYTELLKETCLNPSKKLAELIARELRKPLYLPRKRDNSFRRYRFPNVRAKNIIEAARCVYNNHYGLYSILKRFNSSVETRDFLATTIPGIGLKEASHFLRNIGYADNLAIIDVHIISFLKEKSLINSTEKININPSVYRKLESIMQNIAIAMNMNLAILDMAIWQYMRNK